MNRNDSQLAVIPVVLRVAILLLAMIFPLHAAQAQTQWDFDYTMVRVNSPNADQYLESVVNATRVSEGGNGVSYWCPATPGTGKVKLRFDFISPIVQARFLGGVYSANFGSQWGATSLWASKDNANWVQLLSCPHPVGIDCFVVYDQDLPASLLGGTTLWVEARLYAQGWNIMSQFLRPTDPLPPAVLRLQATYGCNSSACNQALQLDGSSYIRVPDSASLDLSGPMTVECWVKSNAVPGALLQKWGDDSIDDRSYSFEIEPDNRIQFGVSRDDTQSDSAYHGFLVGPVSTTQWRHIACTYDGLVRQTFVDGELVGTKPTSGSIHAGVTDLSIGGHLRNNNGIFSNGFNGLMDEVRLWNVARTRDEIRATINTRITPTSSGNYPGLVSCYNFEGSAGDSRGVNNGNPVGSATYVPVPDIPVLFDCNGNSVYDGAEIAANPALDLNANGILDSCECLVTSYCVGAPNSVGSGAVMDHAGTVSLGINNLTLLCTACPPNTAGVFFYGPQQTQVAFGNGFRCVGGSITRTGPTAASGGGIAARNINFAAFPFNTTISAGSTQNFQFWYRNAAAGGAGFNLSNGLSIRFCP